MRKFLSVCMMISLLALVSCTTQKSSDDVHWVSDSDMSREASQRRSTRNDRPPNSEPGRCYAKCLIANTREFIDGEWAVYTGDEAIEHVDLKTLVVSTGPSTTKWVKKKSEVNCTSRDPDDCLVWCLVDVPSSTSEINVLIDTTQSPNYQLRTLIYEVVVEGRQLTEWREVVCSGSVSSRLVSQVKQELRNKGYNPGIGTNLDVQSKAALISFQKENGLPIGQFDLETLEKLGVKY